MNDCIFSKVCNSMCICKFYTSVDSKQGEYMYNEIEQKMISQIKELQKLEIELLEEEFQKIKIDYREKTNE